ncbi:MAG: flavodoxin family protein [Verrucomicrobiales bacterium]|nr:flavodoxin family protein [Verrucomicrobiales bacterium]MED5586663.1 flavodoxin family protein [Verrucomicrobiota bacterium]
MGNILILYHSNTGNTAKMADFVAEGAASVSGMEIRKLTTDEATADDLQWCDGIALGSPTNMGSMAWKVKKWWDTEAIKKWLEIDGKFACAFSSSAGWGGGNETACNAMATVLLNFGFLYFGVTDYVGKGLTPHYGAVIAGEPRGEKEKESCRRLGRRLSEWVGYYREGRAELHPNKAQYPRDPKSFE